MLIALDPNASNGGQYHARGQYGGQNHAVIPGKECDGASDCKFWSFVATRTKCLLLKSCDKPEEEDGVESGARGCAPE